MFVFLQFFLFSVKCVLFVFAFNGDSQIKELGEEQYHLIKAKSTLPQHGKCWHEALKAIKGNCEKLNDHEHSVLALYLANCFLEDSGHVTYSCHLSETENERRKCINEMTDRAFGVYNEFYTHTSHVCFFLSHEIWQAETETTIKHLYKASTHMKEQISEAAKMQSVVLERQKEGLEMQNQLLDNGLKLEGVIQNSAETVNNIVSDFKESARDQKQLLFQIFSYIRTFQNWIIGEVSWFQSILYYIISCIFAALFSATKKTLNSRISLFTILSFNIIIERMLVKFYANDENNFHDDKIQLLHSTWIVRKCALLLCFLTLFYTYFSYKDEQLENYKVLQRIENQLQDLNELKPMKTTHILRFSERLAIKRLSTSSNTSIQ